MRQYIYFEAGSRHDPSISIADHIASTTTSLHQEIRSVSRFCGSNADDFSGSHLHKEPGFWSVYGLGDLPTVIRIWLHGERDVDQAPRGIY